MRQAGSRMVHSTPPIPSATAHACVSARIVTPNRTGSCSMAPRQPSDPRLTWFFVLIATALTFASGYVVGVAGPAKLNGLNRVIRAIRTPPIFSSPRFQYLPGEADVVMLGDSITAATQWHELMSDVKVINRGVEGDTIRSAYLRLAEVLRRRPKKIFAMLGINDVRAGRSHSAILADYEALIHVVRARKVDLYMESILYLGPDAGGARFNAEIKSINDGLRDLCAANSVHYIDLIPVLCPSGQLDKQVTMDGLHLNGLGYLLWAEALRKYVK